MEKLYVIVDTFVDSAIRYGFVINKETPTHYYIKNENYFGRNGKELKLEKSNIIGFTYDTALKDKKEKRLEYSKKLIDYTTKKIINDIMTGNYLASYMFCLSYDKYENKTISLISVDSFKRSKVYIYDLKKYEVDEILDNIINSINDKDEYYILKLARAVYFIKIKSIYKISIDVGYCYQISFKFNNHSHATETFNFSKEDIIKVIKDLQQRPELKADLISLAKSSKEILKAREDAFATAKRNYERRETEYSNAKEFYESLPDEIKLLAEI